VKFCRFYKFYLLLAFAGLSAENPSANPIVEKSWSGFANAAFLYWWTAEEGLAFALGNGKVFNPQMKPEIGFKFGVGAYLPHDGWDFLTNLTHLHSRAKVEASEERLTPLWILPGPGGYVDSIRGHWRLHFAFIDFELGRRFFWSPYLTMRLHCGVRYVISRQKYLIHYQGGTLFPDGESYVSMKTKYLAPGMRTGADLEWNIYDGLSLYSNMAFSLQYGSLYVHEAEKVSFEDEKRYNIFNTLHVFKPILDLAGGLQWETFVHQRRLHLILQAGWEEHLLWGQNQFFNFPAQGTTAFSSSQGNLALGGLTLGATLSY
jgi:hypothetical protein